MHNTDDLTTDQFLDDVQFLVHWKRSHVMIEEHRQQLRAQPLLWAAANRWRFRQSDNPECRMYPQKTPGKRRNTISTDSGCILRKPLGKETISTDSGCIVRRPLGKETHSLQIQEYTSKSTLRRSLSKHSSHIPTTGGLHIWISPQGGVDPSWQIWNHYLYVST